MGLSNEMRCMCVREEEVRDVWSVGLHSHKQKSENGMGTHGFAAFVCLR